MLCCVEDPGHLVDWKKRGNISLPYQLPVCLGLFTPGVTKRLIPIGTSLPGNCLKNYPGEGEEIPSLRGHKQSGPSGHPPGPFGVCNPNEKPKPPPLININVNIASHKKPFASHSYTFDFRNIERLRHSVSAKLADFHLISNAESACSVLINTLEEEIIHNSIKKVNRRSVPIQPWISYGLLACINKKNNLHKKFVHSVV